MTESTIHERPKVGLGVLIVRDGKILFGERIAKHGAGTFTIPGGHLEFGESFEQCAKREVEEETGLNDITIKGVVCISNDIAYDKHYVSITMLAESLSGEPVVTEPEKLRNWKWYDPHNLPDPIYIPTQKSIKNWLEGKFYSD